MFGRDGIRANVALATVIALCAVPLAGCGLSSSTPPTGVSVLVTSGDGDQQVAAYGKPPTSRGDTALKLLRRVARGVTEGPAGSIASIDGVSATSDSAWFYYVNGVAERRRPAKSTIHTGDAVWWDRHAASPQRWVRAVVGSFPEPFLDGIAGKHLPLRIECTSGESRPCNTVQKVFDDLGLVASEGCLLCSQYNESLRVVVGPWSALAADPAALRLGRGPDPSGVFARFEDGGRRLALLDQSGQVVRTAGAGAGLIAATRYEGQPPVWYVTGTDEAGVAAAVQAFDAGTLDQHFAIAVIDDAAIPLPDVVR